MTRPKTKVCFTVSAPQWPCSCVRKKGCIERTLWPPHDIDSLLCGTRNTIFLYNDRISNVWVGEIPHSCRCCLCAHFLSLSFLQAPRTRESTHARKCPASELHPIPYKFLFFLFWPGSKTRSFINGVGLWKDLKVALSSNTMGKPTPSRSQD